MSSGGISAYKSARSITLRYIDVDGVVSVQSTIVGSQYDRYLQFELITIKRIVRVGSLGVKYNWGWGWIA